MQAFGLVAGKTDFIPGIRGADELLEIGLYEKKEYVEVLHCTTKEAIDGVCLLRDKVGVLGGPTAGINFYKSLEILKELDKNLVETKNAVFIVCDRYEWYIDYYKKYRPDMFGLTNKRSWLDNVTDFTSQAQSIDVATYINNQNSYFVVDTRVAVSYTMDHLPNAINFPYDELSELLNKAIPFSKSQKILFVCTLGNRSLHLSGYLRSKGYDATSLSGGMSAVRDFKLT
jgi:cysteine synthase B